MPEEQLVKLLEEIRDLQKRFIENQKTSIANQQQSLEKQALAVENQKKAMARARSIQYLVIALIVVLGVVPMLLWATSFLFRLAPMGH